MAVAAPVGALTGQDAGLTAFARTSPHQALVPGSSDPQVTSLAVGPEPDGSPVTLDVAVYPPAGGGRHPAVLLAHGFGGSRTDLDAPARELADHGYLAVAYTARGFGGSGGRIHLDDPAYEVADAAALVTAVASRDDVELDSAGDPRVGVSGGSYGGALALMLAGADPRIDAVAAGITWNDLATSFFPSETAGAAPTPVALDPAGSPGVYKRRWASWFFTSALAASAPTSATTNSSAGTSSTAPSSTGTSPTAPTSTGTSPTGTTPSAAASPPGARRTDPRCGRFDPQICAQFLAAAATGGAPGGFVSELRRHSPAPTNAAITAPTLLIQGTNDSLFGLDQADANARQISATGTRVAMRWFAGGHDGGELPAQTQAVLPWFDTYLRSGPDQARRRDLPGPGFVFTAPSFRRNGPVRALEAPAYPGLATPTPGALGSQTIRLGFADGPRRGTLLSPPGGDPAATLSIPGLSGGVAPSASAVGGVGAGGATVAGDPLGAAAYRLAALPAQSVAFDTTPVTSDITVVGAPRVRLTVTSTTTDATLFVSLWKVAAGSATAPVRRAAPIRVVTQPGQPRTVEVALPSATYALEPGSTWRVLVSATDATYASPTDARTYTVGLADDALVLPTLPTATEPPVPMDAEVRGVGIALLAALTLVLAGAVGLRRLRRRTDASHTRTDLLDVPLSVERLVKTYADGHRAVDDVSWEARAGQVVGLLGPNGAGKTTTIRMIAGLIRPDSGEVHVHGHPAHAGAPALAGVGTLIEGPGFLPHLSGRANLEAYWDATGRPRAEALFDEALAVAALGDAVERPVKTYSQGMRQRLGVAQAMLGMPEVLILDEPTNGLDPPQIAAMRPILRRYAETGRTVVVSSHLLAEVELTCSHVVVMHRGRVVTAGAVADLVERADTTIVELEGDVAAARAVAARLSGPVRRGLRRTVLLPGLVSAEVESASPVEATDPGAPVSRLVVVAQASRDEVVAAVREAGGRIAGVGGRRHLEEVFLGVIAADDLDAARAVRPR